MAKDQAYFFKEFTRAIQILSTVAKASLIVLLALLSTLLEVQGVVIPLNSTALTPDLLASVCTGQGSRMVCDPFSRPDTYVACGSTPVKMRCPKGKAFDYVARRCKSKKSASLRPCPLYACPASRGPALSGPYGPTTPGSNLSYTFALTNKTSFAIYCPLNGHCLGGMMIPVNVACPAPADRYPYTFIVDYDQTLTNNMMYPQHLAPIEAFCGDSIFLGWDGYHLVQVFNTRPSAEPLWQGMQIMPFPPQPVYECPVWVGNSTQPGEVVLAPVGVGPGSVNWTETEPSTYFLVCPGENHCRLGMVFKVTVLAAPAGYTPKTVMINWVITTNQLPDLTVTVGDTVVASWPSLTFHGVSKLPFVASIP